MLLWMPEGNVIVADVDASLASGKKVSGRGKQWLTRLLGNAVHNDQSEWAILILSDDNS